MKRRKLPHSVHKFRLFIAGDTLNSMQALTNITGLCRMHLGNNFDIEVVDVFSEPTRAMEEGILMTPTLVKLLPLPLRLIVGTLGQTQTVLTALGIGCHAA